MKKTASSTFTERADYTWSKDSIRFINTPSISSNSVFFYVQEVGDFHTSYPYFTEREYLNSFLIIYTISGKGVLRYKGNTYHLMPESIAYINCMEAHHYECLSNQNWEFLWLHFNGASALGYYEEFLKNEFHVLKAEDPDFIEVTLRRILALTQKKDLHSEILTSGLIINLLTRIIIENSSEHLHLGFMPLFIKDSLKEIEQHFQEPLTLEYLAQKADVSKYHFAREFHRYIGTTPNEYLILTRLNHAKSLLKYSALSIEEITFQCGFHNVSHFINSFKKRVQMTPLQFRKEWGY